MFGFKKRRSNGRLTRRERTRILTAEQFESRALFAALLPDVIDDGPDTRYVQTGVWNLRNEPTAYQSDTREATTGLAANGTVKTAKWTFAVAPGTYRIDASWPYGNNRATNAPYTFSDGTLTVGSASVDQRYASYGPKVGTVQFQTIGTVTITGRSLTVMLTNIGTNGNLIADAIHIVPVAPPPPPAPAKREPILSLYSTGVQSNATTGAPATFVAAGQVDPHYKLLSSTSAGQPAYKTIDNSYPFVGYKDGVWARNDAASAWVSPHAGQNGSEPVGDYRYQTQFDLTSFDPATVQIKGRIYSDNGLTSVTLNGVATNVAAGGFGGTDFTLPTTGYVAGLNTLVFTVNNSVGRSTNPSGLRVAMTGTALLRTAKTTASFVPDAATVRATTVRAATVDAIYALLGVDPRPLDALLPPQPTNADLLRGVAIAPSVNLEEYVESARLKVPANEGESRGQGSSSAMQLRQRREMFWSDLPLQVVAAESLSRPIYHANQLSSNVLP